MGRGVAYHRSHARLGHHSDLDGRPGRVRERRGPDDLAEHVVVVRGAIAASPGLDVRGRHIPLDVELAIGRGQDGRTHHLEHHEHQRAETACQSKLGRVAAHIHGENRTFRGLQWFRGGRGGDQSSSKSVFSMSSRYASDAFARDTLQE